MTLKVGDGNEVHFLWDPYLNNTRPSMIPTSWGKTLVVSAGLWQARYLDDNHLTSFEQHSQRLIEGFRNTSSARNITQPFSESARHQLIFLPVSHPVLANLDPDRAAILTPDRTMAINENLRLLAQKNSFEVMWAALPMTNGHPAAFESGGLHVTEMIASQQLNLLTNRLCNADARSGPKHTCCSSPGSINMVQTIILCLSLYIVLLYLQRSIGKNATRNGASLLKSCAIMAAVSIYCFTADRTNIFDTVNKLVDTQAFLIACGVSLLLGVVSVARIQTPKSYSDTEKEQMGCGILPRQQTEEWKGWMQIVILLYHYFGTSSTLWVYRVIRVLVASYLFLTGYGHTQHFIKTNDFSLRRVIGVLVRLNLLSCILLFVMGTRYDFYYFPTLSSFWFIVTWSTLRRHRGNFTDLRRVLMTVALSAAVMELLLQSRTLQTNLFNALKSFEMLSVDQYEFAFRTRLDRFVPYIGMITALVLSKYERSLLSNNYCAHPRRKLTMALLASASLLAIAGYWYWFATHGTKQGFNSIHPFTAPVPILAFIVLRNALPCTRNWYSRFFAWVGRHSLEMYILQHHIWLAADAKGILRLGILDGWLIDAKTTVSSRWFWAETMLLTVVFLWVSCAVSNATSTIVRWVVFETNTRPQTLIPILQPRTPHGSGRLWHGLRPSLSPSFGMRSKVVLFILLLWQLNLLW